ncbi:hypothetical protein SDC9_164709 [bioreactor metagenome]|uniref:Uncharacterized protein n=1 Tax=bioreactor metagenome TaxID=1076179 RepID=A0A645FUA5_9ZZZZ
MPGCRSKNIDVVISHACTHGEPREEFREGNVQNRFIREDGFKTLPNARAFDGLRDAFTGGEEKEQQRSRSDKVCRDAETQEQVAKFPFKDFVIDKVKKETHDKFRQIGPDGKHIGLGNQTCALKRVRSNGADEPRGGYAGKGAGGFGNYIKYKVGDEFGHIALSSPRENKRHKPIEYGDQRHRNIQPD